MYNAFVTIIFDFLDRNLFTFFRVEGPTFITQEYTHLSFGWRNICRETRLFKNNIYQAETKLGFFLCVGGYW